MKGADEERELAKKAWEHGWAPLRAPGSGSIDRPSPDVILAKEPIIKAIELKSESNGTAWFEGREINELEEWCYLAGAIPYVGVKPDLRKKEHNQWYFIRTGKLHKTDGGFSIRKQDHDRAKSIQELLAD
jgi:Holliday junction resolvase